MTIEEAVARLSRYQTEETADWRVEEDGILEGGRESLS